MSEAAPTNELQDLVAEMRRNGIKHWADVLEVILSRASGPEQPTPEQTDLERAQDWYVDRGLALKGSTAVVNSDVASLAAEFARVREEMKEQCAKEKK
jgi:hypothetical protein